MIGLDFEGVDWKALYTVKVGVLKETAPGENRVAVPPLVAADLIKKGFPVFVEENAGARAGFGDQQYKDCRCMVTSREQVVSESQIVICIDANTKDFESMNGSILVAWVGRHLEAGKAIVEQAIKAEIVLMDFTSIPRIPICRPFDVLSSQAAIAGGRALKEAVHVLGQEEEHANTVLVLGLGVAGLEAVRAAKRQGFLVRAWDVRDMKEQVEALGATWITGHGMSVAANGVSYKIFEENTEDADIVITTAAIPGRRSPLLITDDMVKEMKPGSVIVDLAASGGGNCTMTRKDQKYITDNGVTIIGYTNLPSCEPKQASLAYGKNVYNFIQYINGENPPFKFLEAIGDALVDESSPDVPLTKNDVLTAELDEIVIRNMTCCVPWSRTQPHGTTRRTRKAHGEAQHYAISSEARY